jgi:hypothetical protein
MSSMQSSHEETCCDDTKGGGCESRYGRIVLFVLLEKRSCDGETCVCGCGSPDHPLGKPAVSYEYPSSRERTTNEPRTGPTKIGVRVPRSRVTTRSDGSNHKARQSSQWVDAATLFTKWRTERFPTTGDDERRIGGFDFHLNICVHRNIYVSFCFSSVPEGQRRVTGSPAGAVTGWAGLPTAPFGPTSQKLARKQQEQ